MPINEKSEVPNDLPMGQTLAAIFREIALTDQEIALIEEAIKERQQLDKDRTWLDLPPGQQLHGEPDKSTNPVNPITR